MDIVAPEKEIIAAIKTSGGDAFKSCYQCGMCDTVCPWNRVAKFSMRKIVREATFGLTEIDSEDIWRCTTCGKCPQVCPRDVKQIESGVALRRIATEYDVFPGAASPIPGVAASLKAEGNPFGEARSKRADWAKDLNVKRFEEGMEVLYSPGCYLSYDPRGRKIAKATVEILQAAGVDFGILGSDESCCGESIRKTGDEKLFKSLARQNIRNFVDNGVTKILVSSPHCYHSFKNEYAEFKVNFEVLHITEFVFQLIESGRLKLTKEVAQTVTYHDPCYLGRHNGVYEQPREALKAVPGLKLKEMSESRKNSFCCGGGGGRIWMETPKGERFADLRLEQAVGTGAQVLATACPYCTTNFEDSRLNRPDGGASIEVKDITEIIREAI
ncbi:MAG: (Fe-S)-binding protein [Sterolibacterium sp.]|jgi:Fe-S oxidoreductase